MKNKLLLCLATLLVCLQASAAVVMKDGHPQQHVVVKGDTLWDISGMFLRDPWQWPEIWQVNPQIANPHLIFPGDVINLVYFEGQPRIKVTRGPNGNTVRLTPKMRLSPVDNAIPPIPLEKINAFLSRSRIVDEGDLEAAPYVLAGGSRHLITGAGDDLYARGAFDEADVIYGVYRKGETFIDPETKEILGIAALDIGGVKKLSVEDGVGHFQINRSNEEIRIEDRLLPNLERKVSATFVPSAPDEKIEGHIAAVEGGVSQIGFMNIVILNKGERDGLEVGHVLAIDRLGETVVDRIKKESIKLPDVRSGLLMVFRTYEKMSYGLVLRATQPLAVMDRVHNP